MRRPCGYARCKNALWGPRAFAMSLRGRRVSRYQEGRGSWGPSTTAEAAGRGFALDERVDRDCVPTHGGLRWKERLAGSWMATDGTGRSVPIALSERCGLPSVALFRGLCTSPCSLARVMSLRAMDGSYRIEGKQSRERALGEVDAGGESKVPPPRALRGKPRHARRRSALFPPGRWGPHPLARLVNVRERSTSVFFCSRAVSRRSTSVFFCSRAVSRRSTSVQR